MNDSQTPPPLSSEISSGKTSTQGRFNQKEKELKFWIIALRASPFFVLFFPFGGIIAPAIIWALKKNEFAEIDRHGKEVLNFTLTYHAIFFVLLLFGLPFSYLGYISSLSTIGHSPLAMLFTFIPTIFFGFIGFIIFCIQVVFLVTGIIKANANEFYSYPWIFRFLG